MEKERTGYWGKDSAGRNYPPIFGIPLILGIILIAFLFMWKLVPVEVDGAEETTYRRDQSYVDFTRDDVDVWDNGKGVSVSGGGKVYASEFWGDEYLVFVSKYLDTDGEYTTEVSIFFYGKTYKTAYYDSKKMYTLDDASTYFQVYFKSQSSYAFSETQAELIWIKMRNGLFMDKNKQWTEAACCYSHISLSGKTGEEFGSYIYASPFFNGKYLVYSSYEYTDTSDTHFGFPVNLLPNSPKGEGATGIPFHTTFRMLTGDAMVYNTFYYTSSYKSGADTISASGTIRCDATKFSDGKITRTVLSAPQLLCQISSYGTVYDIVSTNDTNLLSLLGISKPEEKYWDVASQTWKPVFSGGIGGGGNAGGEIGGGIIGGGSGDGGTTGKFDFNYSLSPLENFSRWLATKGYPVASGVAHFFSFEFIEDAGDYLDQFGEILSDYLDYFVYNEEIQRFGLSKDGLGENWKKLKESAIADSVTDEFINRFKFDETVKHYTWSSQMISTAIPGLNAGLVLNSGGSTGGTGGDGSGTGGTGGNGSGSTGGGGTGGNGSGSTGGGGTGGNGSGGTGGSGSGGGDLIIGGPQWDAIGEFGSNVQGGIVEGVTSTGSFLSGVLGSVKGILEGLGSLPVLLADLYSFLPSEITLALGVGLGLWILPALLGLARTGLKSIGNMFSSLFGLISSLFS